MQVFNSPRRAGTTVAALFKKVVDGKEVEWNKLRINAEVANRQMPNLYLINVAK